MFGLHWHHGRHAAHRDDAGESASGKGTVEPDGPPETADLAAWSEEVARFMNKRAGSYGLLLEEMRTSRSLFELAAVQQRWWLSTIQDYAGLASSFQEKAPPSDQEDGRSV